MSGYGRRKTEAVVIFESVLDHRPSASRGVLVKLLLAIVEPGAHGALLAKTSPPMLSFDNVNGRRHWNIERSIGSIDV